jgi:AAA+ superfamily predicted ATPase
VEEKQYRLEHIIGYEKEKAICLKIIQTIQEAKKIKNAQKKAGILFFGPPGCGKTNFVKTIAAEANVPMLSISMQDLINERGMITNNLHIAFNVIKEYRKKNGPCIIFFDEFDFLIGNR